MKEYLFVWSRNFIAGVSVFIVDFLGNKSIKTIGYSKTQMFLPLIPIFSTLISMVLFQQWFEIIQWIGLIIVSFGIYFMMKDKTKNA